ncbi:tetratricopeptide repeat protein [Treponema parvum]|uniref:tetratricopeptide repeat protein n=1 Tax=Treponema parvum TaxID=138851 RepID=UPI001AEBBC82|nr:hypothetical protein [Treponema parvum]QTQ16555.1 hypothetical protein HXT04_07555 [Treponema parvum]
MCFYKKRIAAFVCSVTIFFLFIASSGAQAQTGRAAQNSAKTANRQTAVRCLQLAKTYINQRDWAAASSNIEMGLGYDSGISDLWYFDAVVKTNTGSPRAEVKPLVERALTDGEWVDYDRDNARILYADILSDTGLYEKALEVLDAQPFLFSADAEYIRVKSFYRMHTEEGLYKARDKVDAARRVYPHDYRFAGLFFRNEYKFWDRENATEQLRRIADFFIASMPSYSRTDPELELYAALFAKREESVRLLKSYEARGLSHPMFASAALKVGLLSEKAAVEYFTSFSDTSVSLEDLTALATLITDEEVKSFLREYLMSYDGFLTVDTDEDLEANLFVDYFRGRPKNVRWDKNNDGIDEWTAVCDFGVPVSVELPEKQLDVGYGSYPYVNRVSVTYSDGREKDIFIADEKFAWTPFDIAPYAFFTQILDCEFYVPHVHSEIPAIDEKELTAAAIYYETDSGEYDGARVRFSVLDGIPAAAYYTLNGKQYAKAFFENGIITLRIVDRDGDGIFETTETYAVDNEGDMALSEEGSRRIVNNVYGLSSDIKNLYVKTIRIDLNKDTVPDFTEEYLPYNGKITSWDYDNDGQWDVRYVRYPQKQGDNLLEDAMFYLAPGRSLAVVSSLDGEPVKIVYDNVEYAVEKGDLPGFYWVGDGGSLQNERDVITALEAEGEQGKSVLVESGENRILSVKMAERYFGRMIPAVPESENGGSPETAGAADGESTGAEF